MGRSAPPSRPIARACADGSRAWHEPEEGGLDRQSAAGAVEGAAAGVHRGSVLEAVRSQAAGGRHVDRAARRGAVATQGRAQGGEGDAPRRRRPGGTRGPPQVSTTRRSAIYGPEPWLTVGGAVWSHW